MTLERAIQRITSEPAAFFGIKNRGRLMPGLAADVTIFDYNTVGSNARGEMRNDLPGGGRRLVMPARGIEYTVVNGNVLYDHGQLSGNLPGQVRTQRSLELRGQQIGGTHHDGRGRSWSNSEYGQDESIPELRRHQNDS